MLHKFLLEFIFACDLLVDWTDPKVEYRVETLSPWHLISQTFKFTRVKFKESSLPLLLVQDKIPPHVRKTGIRVYMHWDSKQSTSDYLR